VQAALRMHRGPRERSDHSIVPRMPGRLLQRADQHPVYVGRHGWPLEAGASGYLSAILLMAEIEEPGIRAIELVPLIYVGFLI
jgi:hypothetical protein